MIRLAQIAMMAVGALIIFLLVFEPEIGMKVFWGTIITLGPLLFALIPTVWRNICPMGVVSMLPRWLGISGSKKLNPLRQKQLLWTGFVLLIFLPPLRTVLFDRSAIATAALLLFFAVGAFLLGMIFDGKSAFCNSLCPVSPVETLYGQYSAIKMKNASCGSCTACSQICYELSQDRTLEKMTQDPKSKNFSELLIGGFPGYVFGWFQIPKVPYAHFDFYTLLDLYSSPLIMMSASLGVYFALKTFSQPEAHGRMRGYFAAIALAIYYWFRIPVILGFGKNPEDALFLLNDAITAPVLFAIRSVLPVLIVLWFARRIKGQRLGYSS